MTTVWRLRPNVTAFKSLVDRPNVVFKTGSLLPEQCNPFPRAVGTRQLETWEPLRVWYDPTEFEEGLGMANFPSWSAATVVCDVKAKEIVRELIEDHVELLPLAYYPSFEEKAIHSNYYAINVLQILDCLDFERSEFTRFKSTGGIRSIVKYEFRANCIGGIPIFKLPILNSIRTFVTDEFKQLVEDNNLTGLKFRKVWEG